MRIKNALSIAFLIMLAAGAQPAIGAFWQWSKTATNNSTADPSINWSEGMSPSSVNDSARAMMARLAEQGADTSGSLTTAGGPTAYTLTTNQGLQTPAPVDGQLIAFTANVSNSASPTLAVDGGTAYPIQSSPGNALPAATFVAGSPYTMKYSVSNNAWLVRNYYASPAVIPLGGLIPFTGTVSPASNFVFPAGQCLSTTTYAAYWALVGSPAPGTCGAGTFRILDMSGRVAAGLDTMPGSSAANRLTSAANGCGTAMTTVGAVCANGNEGSILATANLPAYTPSGSVSTSTSITQNAVANVISYQGGSGGFSVPGGGASITASSSSTFTGNAQGGSSQQFTNVPPTIGVTYLLRVL